MATTQTPVEEGLFGYPSHFVAPDVKNDKQWCRQYITALDKESTKGTGNYIFRSKADEYAEWRAYARGDQDIDQYKKVLLNPRHKRKGGKQDRDQLSYKNLDWSVLAVGPKFVNVLVGRLIGQDNGIGIRAVDPQAEKARKKKEISMQEYLINQKFYEDITKATGIQFESPMEDDIVPPPTNLSEIKLHMEMFYKEHYCLTLMDMLTLLNSHDGYAQILKEVAVDLIQVGVGATRTYRIGKRVKRRRCIPERMTTNHCKSEDFKDFQHGGEYWDLTIGELRELAGNQFTEDEYKKIAEQTTRSQFHDIDNYFNKNNCYPYDHVRITVFDAVWFSADIETYQEKPNQFGNVTVYEKEFGWMSHVSTDDFNNSPINKAAGSRIIRREMNNLYQGMLIVGTDFVFNTGKCKDMLRNESDIGTAIGPFMIYSLGFDSIIRQIKPVLDSIQRNFLQYQHHINKSRPMGLDIEYTALQDVNIGGKGGTKMTPKEILELYFDTGILLWKRRDWSGQANNWRPISELQNGLSAAAKDHFLNIIQEIDLLRSIIGLNELVDASTPGAETGKKVAEIAAGAVEDAIRYVHHAFDQINIGTCLRTVMHISAMAVNGMAPDYTEAIGLDNMAFLGTMSEMGMHEYGAYLIRQPSIDMKAKIAQYVTEALRSGSLLPEEAFEIEQEKNPYRVIKLLKMYRIQKEQKTMQNQQQMYQMEQQKNTESAQATEDAKRQTLKDEYDLKTQFEFNKAQANAIAQQNILKGQILLEKLKQGHELSMEDKERMTKLMVSDNDGQWALMVAQQKADQAARAKKETAKKT
jgi:hypothetical protein